MDTLIMTGLWNKKELFHLKLDKGDELTVQPIYRRPERSLTDYHIIILDFRGGSKEAVSFFMEDDTNLVEIRGALNNGTVVIVLISENLFFEGDKFKLIFFADAYFNFEKKVKKHVQILKACPSHVQKYLLKISGIKGIITNSREIDKENKKYYLLCDYNSEFRKVLIEPFLITELGNELAACKVHLNIPGRIFLLPALDEDSYEQFQLLYEIGKNALKKVEERPEYAEPEWLKDFRILDEGELLDNRAKLNEELSTINSTLADYRTPKSAIYIKNDDLIEPVRAIFHKLGYKTDRTENYEEDFWILDNKNEKAIICEVKSCNGSIARKHINNLDDHREMNGLPTSFPALLIANTSCKAKSLKEKDVEISPDIRKHATNNDILIVRTLDLLNMLTLVQKPDSEVDMFELLVKNKGWLQASEKGHKIRTS